MQGREQRKDHQLKEVSTEVLQLRNEMTRTEGVNNNLQGYGLDNLGDQDLANLVNQMNQVQLESMQDTFLTKSLQGIIMFWEC